MLVPYLGAHQPLEKPKYLPLPYAGSRNDWRLADRSRHISHADMPNKDATSPQKITIATESDVSSFMFADRSSGYLVPGSSCRPLFASVSALVRFQGLRV
jgi:hypothetical protein